ncbi:MAG: prolyl oligopeptidase family serine peptidase [Gemmatimonadaceae bacterium]
MTRFFACSSIAAVVLYAQSTVEAQSTYRLPPSAMTQVMDAPAAPAASVSPDRKWLLVTVSDPRSITIEDMAEPAHFLAGRKISPVASSRVENIGIQSATLQSVDGSVTRALKIPSAGRIGTVAWSPTGSALAYSTIANRKMSLRVQDAATGREREYPGTGGKIQDLNWSRDGMHLAFTVTTAAGVALWISDAAGTNVSRLTPPMLNHVNGGCSWIGASTRMLCRMNVADRGAEPKQSGIPSGPIVQESYGRKAPSRTYEYLLASPHDEALFDHYFTNQLAIVGVDGTLSRIGKPGVHTLAQPSPSGQYILVETVHPPYSYQMPLGAFASATEIWTTSGTMVKQVVKSDIPEEAPSARDAVLPGIRSVTWRPDVPATLVLVEALDNGDPKMKVDKRDRVSMLSAPFADKPVTLGETEYRYAGITWATPTVALLNERLSRTGRLRTWVIDPSLSGGTSRMVWDRSGEDRYADPGTLVTVRDVSGRDIPLSSSDGKWMYLRGAGASAEGDRPFLDRIDVISGKTERIWRSAAPHYESVVHVADNDAARVITQRESLTEPPNYFLRDTRTGTATQITKLGDPAPYFANVRGELIRYRRDDGVELSATMYLPAGYDKSKGPLPFYFWAYPREFLSAHAASQVTGSPHQYRRPARQTHLLLLTQGYGILDGPTMPIVGMNGKEPNDTYIEQLVASAKAAIDKIVELGVGDRDRVAVGGHSYGAFMTANLLAHSNLFRTGIAESGAYNRSLTPFGFQAEPRTYWEAQDIYSKMSPFNYAHQINEPVLLIHGQRDDNSGTFPIQSERLYSAIKGNGGSVRYVQLPLEPHGYTARETTRHVAWETINWLDKYLKNAKPSATAARE